MNQYFALQDIKKFFPEDLHRYARYICSKYMTETKQYRRGGCATKTHYNIQEYKKHIATYTPARKANNKKLVDSGKASLNKIKPYMAKFEEFVNSLDIK